jgi:ubiquinone/menaquinone biosynthesis C-methylase UbiE
MGQCSGVPRSGLSRVNYDGRLHEVYAKGRGMSAERLQQWMAVFSRHLPAHRPLSLLDLGSGVGRLTPALAATFGGPVVGVEPSGKMLAQALSNAPGPNVTYLTGSGESIPLPTASCDAALVFFVWHHVTDKPAAAAELHRVVRPGGRLLVRTNLSDRMPDLWWYRWLPGAREVDRKMYRSLSAVVRDFTSAGWSWTTLDEVETVAALSIREDFERLRTRALSTFEHLPEDVAMEGFAAIESALETMDDGPLVTRGDLLVFERFSGARDRGSPGPGAGGPGAGRAAPPAR